jgi:hypothetical protein
MAGVQVFHDVMTLDATVQSLVVEGLSASSPIREIHLTADSANTHVIYVGGTNKTLTSANAGDTIPTPVSSIPAAPLFYEGFQDGTISMGAYRVLGTNGEKLHIMVHAYI